MSSLLGKKVDFTADSVVESRAQYVSFEGGDAKKEPTLKEYKLDPANVVCFFGRKNFLSNFSESPMVIGGHLYPSVEHYYEACKVYAVAGPYPAMQLKGCPDAGQVKSLGKRLIADAGRSKREVEKWKRNDGVLVARVGLMEKFRQNPGLREKLLKTGDALLVQTNQYETLWAVGMDTKDFKEWLEEHKGETIQVPACIEADSVRLVPDLGKGKNLLGFVMMYVRECMRSEFGNTAQPQSLVPGMKKLLLSDKATAENGDGRKSSSSSESDKK